jgi:apolipoprotein N-acyltransferase
VYLADGTEVDSLPAFTRGFMNTTVPLRTSKTPAIFSVQPITVSVLISSSILVLWLMGSSILGRRRK